MEEGDHSQGMWAASGNGQEMDSPSEPPESYIALLTC